MYIFMYAFIHILSHVNTRTLSVIICTDNHVDIFSNESMLVLACFPDHFETHHKQQDIRYRPVELMSCWVRGDVAAHLPNNACHH